MGCLDKLLVCIFGSNDLDDIFCYKTQHMIVIKDRKLGMLNIFCMLGIVVYVLIQLVMNGTYLGVAQIKGSGRFTLLQPTLNCTVAQRESGDFICVPCDSSDNDCYDNYPRVQDLRYCTQSDIPYNKHKMMCRFEESAATGSVFQSSLLVTTKGTELYENKTCSADPLDPLYQGGTCDRIYDIIRRDEYYYAFVSNFSVNVFHSIESPMTRTNQDLTGALHVANNNELCNLTDSAMASFPNGKLTNHAPCWITPNRSNEGADVFLLNTLLASADLDLDDWLYEGSNNTIRDSGSTIVVNIEYTNWKPWEVMFAEAEPRYEYRLSSLHNNSFQSTEAIYDVYPTVRTVLNRWGVRLVVVQYGTMRSFSMLQLLVTAATSLTLITVTTVIVDAISNSLMPDSALYKDYKFKHTPDMSDVVAGRTCATCSHDLQYMKEGTYCAICECETTGGVYRCDWCNHDRCKGCFTKSTLNSPPVADCCTLALNVFDADKSGTLSYSEYCRLESGYLDFCRKLSYVADVSLERLKRVEYDGNPEFTLKEQIHKLSHDDRKMLRRFLHQELQTANPDEIRHLLHQSYHTQI